ncbi:hypothetical protein SAMN05892883_2152 [Jatrophihabitans sp. GAS493]|uniref:hypothetical protein n=1 Tax=Jatrophihabitans sp. GAS493 TaxID=1907575 RepID=UPI000BC0CE6D|nr:hypothetical protein [Jatrophihabitans sp. GAS493]SOD72821.1 hypothetical protein SAMN05892883_2152 [Jatrophihabitans sp. GAS493]
MKKLSRPQLSVLVVAEIVLAVFAWRDLSRRSDEQIRGNRKVWRVIITVNPGNSMLYWLLGRRNHSVDAVQPE